MSLTNVNRFNTPTGKTFLPQSYCEDATGHCSWQSTAPPIPRPIYGLDRLYARPEAPVLFVEGEKAADVAQCLFPAFVAVTTMHGSKSPEKSDFTPIAGRKVYIAPDYDDAGIAYKDTLIGLLGSVGAEIAGTMRIEMLAKHEGPLKVKFDLADAEADGWTADSLAKLGSSLWQSLPNASSAPLQTPAKAMSAKLESTKSVRPKKTQPIDVARGFALAHFEGHIACFNNQMLAYRSGYWTALNTDVEVKRPLLELLGDEVTAGKVNGIFELVKIQYAAEAEKFERTSPLICLNNCTLDPIEGKRLDHSVEHYLTNRLNIEYDVAAKCPLWLQTLEEIFPDTDGAAKIQLLQEYIGYCLIPDTRMHKFLWMVGAGGNGKSLILSIITALIGKVNISYAQIERLQEKFVRAELQGKLVNISSEMSAQATVADGYLKQITAGDMIEAERKNEKPFSFKPYARLIGATNVLPRLLDHSDGFFRRAMILRFNRQFKAEAIDTQREAKLMAELAGIFNWAVAGLQSLLKRGSFELPDSSKIEVEQYRVNSDPVRQFAEEFLTVTEDKDRCTASGFLYERYKSWSVENGYKTLASNQFAERLTGVGIGYQRRSDGRFWKARYGDRTLPISEPARSPAAPRYIV